MHFSWMQPLAQANVSMVKNGNAAMAIYKRNASMPGSVSLKPSIRRLKHSSTHLSMHGLFALSFSVPVATTERYTTRRVKTVAGREMMVGWV